VVSVPTDLGAPGTINDNRLILVCQHFVGFDFQKTARQKHGFVQVALFPFIAFTHIHNGQAIVRVQLIVHFVNGYFFDLLFRFTEKLPKVAHRYP
jgi:hypothetical protein